MIQMFNILLHPLNPLSFQLGITFWL